MARAALTTEQLQAFRVRAVEVAMGLFVEHGYEGLTMRGLAKTLGSEESPRDMAVGPQGRFLYLCVRGPDVLRSYEIDPVTGEPTEIHHGEGTPFGGATVAVRHEETIYLGCFTGERMGVLTPVP